MKGFSSLLVIGLAASAEAARLPLCSAVCLTNGIAATGCKAIDTECICQSPEFMSAVTECVEERCSEDHKSTTLQTAESYCSAAGIHGQLKKREAAPEPVAEPEADPEADPEAWGDHGGFGLGWFRKGGGGRPHWGWGKGRPGPAVAKSPPWKWVPDFNKPGSEEWWKQQVAQWWRDNGYNWWRYNGWHFATPKPKDSSPSPAPWWSHFDENWWQSNAGNWWHGPSGNQGQWHGSKPSWPTAPASTAPEPPPPTSTWTPTSTPTAQPWTDWIHTVTVTATATPSPTHTHTKPSWTPYTTSKPVQTVIPWKDW